MADRHAIFFTTLRIHRAGYPIRYKFQEFVNRYHMLVQDLKTSNRNNSKETSRQIAENTISGKDWQIGNKKIFLKVTHVVAQLVENSTVNSAQLSGNISYKVNSTCIKVLIFSYVNYVEFAYSCSSRKLYCWEIKRFFVKGPLSISNY